MLKTLMTPRLEPTLTRLRRIPATARLNDFHQTTAANPGKLPRVTGIRHWSTPDYTRVAIELEQGVTFKSQRIGHPDRIVFDLPDTKLASTMPGNVDVDDGFLKKIRVAQFERKQTRVVLEVDDQADYNAFWLSNPPRLIIDVRAKGVHGEEVASIREGRLGQLTRHPWSRPPRTSPG